LDLEEESKTKDAIGMLRIISERTLETDNELYACFIDWQKAFDDVKMDQINTDPKEKVLSTGVKEDGAGNCKWISLKV
jgi:hypothetical protein